MWRKCRSTTIAFARLIGLTGWIVLVSFPLAAQQPGGQPGIILHNGKILTVDSQFSIAQAVAITGNQFRAVGSNQDILALAGPDTLVIDLKGKTAIPGLVDTHSHIDSYAESAYGGELGPEKLRRYVVDWRGVRNKDDALNQIRALMQKYQFKPGEWIWFDNALGFISGGTIEQAKIIMDDLNRWEVDKVTPDNPVVLTLGIPSPMGVLINSKAIDVIWNQMGYADVIKKYGRYWVDATGQPEGHLEPPANRIVTSTVGGGAPQDLGPIYKKYMEEWSAIGVTTVSTRLETYAMKAYEWLESRGEMPLRMAYGNTSLFGIVKDINKEMPALAKQVGTGTDFVWLTSVMPQAVDGASTRACTSQPRTGGAYGTLDSWFPQGQCQLDIEFRGAKARAAPLQGNYYREWIMGSGQHGLRFANTHVAGDRSHAMLLSMMEQLAQQYGPDSVKNWAFDHCSLVNPADLPRAGRLGATFSCLSGSIEGGANVAKSYGDEVAHNFLSPVKSMLNAGAKVVFEMDEDGYTWHDLEVFVTRKGRDGTVWGPHERIDRQTALKMITRWAAEYVLKPEKLGSIEPGKLADLVVLNRDYLTIPEEDISELHSRLTVLGGKILYVHRDFAQEYNLRPAGAIVSTYEELKARRKPKESSQGGGA